MLTLVSSLTLKPKTMEMTNKILALKNADLLGNIRQALGADDENDTRCDEQIENLSPERLFSLYIQWEGILGRGEELWDAVTELKKL